MPKNKRIICIIYIAVYFLFFWVAGLFSYTVRNYGDKDGLSMNIGLSVVQDKMGYIWIASQGGLYRFDGDKMTGFTTSDGLPDNYINTLYMDNTQNMWIGSQKGLAKYNNTDGTFSIYDQYDKNMVVEDDTKNINCLLECQEYGLLIGTNGGLWALDTKKTGTTTITRINIKEKNETEELRINAIAVDQPKGIVYLGTPSSGLIILQNRQASRIKQYDGLDINNIQALLMDQQGLWLGTENNLLYYDGHAFIEKKTADSIPKSIKGVVSLFKPKDKQRETLWIGTTSGLFFQEQDKIYWHPASRSLESDFIQAITQDHEGGIWLGTYSGASYLLPHSKFQTFTKQNGLLQNSAFGIHEDKDKRIWIATYGGLTVIDDSSLHDIKIQSFSVRENLPSNNVRSVTCDKENNSIWIGSSSGGLTRVDIKPNRPLPWDIHKDITFTPFPAAQYRFPNNDVREVFTDSHNRLWLGMRNGGIILFDKTKGKERVIGHWDKKNGLRNDNVWFIAEDSKGYIWAGVDYGLCKLIYDQNKKEATITNYSMQEGLNSPDAQGILEDGNVYWIATFGSGLFCLDESKPPNQKFQSFSEEDGILDKYIYRVLKDEKNPDFLWLTTNGGVYVWDKKKKKVFSHYGIQDGMPSNENNSLSGFKDSRGRLWFSTNGGVACLDPTDIPKNNKRPNVYIEEMVVTDNNKKEKKRAALLFDKTPLELADDENNVYIRFTTLSYQFPDSVRFQYRLEGYQDQWITQTGQRFVEYPNLPPGLYTFRVKAYNNEVSSSGPPVEYRFTIHPAYYNTGWFRLLSVFLGVGFVYGFIKYRLAHKEKQKKELERVVAERTRRLEEIQDQLIHQEKLAAIHTVVTRVAHEFINPASWLKNNAEFFAMAWEEILPILKEYAQIKTDFQIMGLPYQEARSEMEKLVDGVKEGTIRIHDLVCQLQTITNKDSFANKESINLNRLIKEALHSSQKFRNPITDSYSCQLEEGLPAIYSNYQLLEQVVKDVIKNTRDALPDRSGEIIISTHFEATSKQVILKVMDQGSGIPPQSIKYLNSPISTTLRDSPYISLGLNISRHIIEKEYGGKLDIEYTLKKGLIATLFFPLVPLINNITQPNMEVKP